MPESENHRKLVVSLVEYIALNYFGGQKGALLIDSSEGCAFTKPPRINNYIPDVFGRLFEKKGIVIGEAKTGPDIENRHTRNQITAFLEMCYSIPGSAFVFAVPWHYTRYGRNLLRLLKEQNHFDGIQTVVIEKLQG
jgi:hypothetical protein